MRQEAEIHRTIPTGWIREKLGNLADKITKGATPTTYGYEFQRSGINFIKIQNVFAGAIDLATITDFISEKAHQSQKKSILKIDDVLFSIAGTIGETSIVKPQHLPANTNQAFAIISGFSELLLPKYLAFQLRSFVSQKTKEKARGGAMNNVSLEDLKHLELLLPPLPEQHRIVAKIEELFSELDKGIESLKTARAQLKVYRQALLKHAFEGKLTAQWREQNCNKLETAAALLKRIQQERAQRYKQQLVDWQVSGGSKPKAPKPLPPLTAEDLAEFPELPKGWGWVRFGELTESSQNGISKRRGETGRDLVVLRLADITEQKISLDSPRTILLTEAEIANYRLFKDDLICIRVNGSADLVGRVISVREDMEVAYCDHFIRYKLLNRVISAVYLQHFFNTHGVRRHVELNKVSSAGQNTVNQEMLSLVFVAVCGAEEQMAIVDQLEQRLSEVDQLDQTITTALQQAEALRQSILKKAFSGQLVPQDPHDEPASALLARIKPGRATVAAKPRKISTGDKLSPVEITPFQSLNMES